MKVRTEVQAKGPAFPYLGRHPEKGLVLVGKYSIIILEGDNGNGWANAPSIVREKITRVEGPVTLENE